MALCEQGSSHFQHCVKELLRHALEGSDSQVSADRYASNYSDVTDYQGDWHFLQHEIFGGRKERKRGGAEGQEEEQQEATWPRSRGW